MEQKGEKNIGIENPAIVNINNAGEVKQGVSLIAETLILLAQEARPLEETSTDLQTYDILEKLDHNSLLKYRFLIEDDTSWYEVDEVLEKLDRAGQKRIKIMREVRSTYREVLGDFRIKCKKSSKMSVVRDHSDAIVDEIINRLCELVLKSDNRGGLYTEDIKQGVKSIVAFGIVDCKVLEKPSKNKELDNADT